jgi:anthranilate phosphoribosyltransferase
MSDLKNILARLAAGEVFSREVTQEIFSFMVSGAATPSQIGALLMGLRMRGESVEELVGAAQAMRDKMASVRAPVEAVDIVGTGGDGAGTYNISTTAAFIVAGAGVPVAKHGNRAVSSKSGAADVLTALGVAVDLSPEGVESCLNSSKLGFMFAPAHHPALRNVMPARVDLGLRTIFNTLGPLLNPAGVTHHLIGFLGLCLSQWHMPYVNLVHLARWLCMGLMVSTKSPRLASHTWQCSPTDKSDCLRSHLKALDFLAGTWMH